MLIIIRKECFCNEQFDVKSCSVQGIYKTADVLANDPDSLACPNPVNVMSEFDHGLVTSIADNLKWNRSCDSQSQIVRSHN